MATVTATVANNTGSTLYRVYKWESGLKTTLMATGTSLPLTFTPSAGSFQYVLETTDGVGCVVTSTPQVVDCTVGLANVDMLFGLGSVDSVCSTNTLITNMFEFKIVDEDVTSSQLNQQAVIGSGTNKTIPNGVTISNGLVIAPLTYSCAVGSPTQAFNRFGFAINKLLVQYPTKTSFNFKLYGKKISGTDHYFRIVATYFSTICNYTATPVANGVDFSRVGTCSSLGSKLLPGPLTTDRYQMTSGFTTFTDLGTITINTLTNQISFTKSSNLV